MIGTLFGPYRIESLLGRGGMGEVYRAVDTGQGGRVVALKLLPSGLADDPAFVARFRREAEIAARVAEPHVVPIHRYGEIDGRLYLDMQLVDGRELGDLLDAGGLAPARAVAIVEQVAAALDAAHADGLVHRDVKPSNILVVDAGAARPEFAFLVDFGIATAVEPGSRTALTRTGAVVGTLAYMAPERFLARPTGPPADVYALACVLHECLTGAKPFPGTGYGPQVLGHLEQPPPRPSSLRAGLPAAFDGVIAAGMAKDPADRPATAGALAAAARRALLDGSVPALPDTRPAWTRPTALPPPPPTVGRRPRRWVAAGLVAALLLTGGVLAGTRPWESAATAAGVLPSGGPISERAIVGPERLAVAEIGRVPVLLDSETIGGTLTAYDLATGERLGRTVPRPVASGTTDGTVAALDGTLVALTADPSGTVRLVDLASAEVLPRVIFPDGVSNTAMTTAELDGRTTLAVGGTDGRIRLADLATGEARPQSLPGGVGGISRLVPFPLDGAPAVLAVGSPGTTTDTISATDLRSGRTIGPPITDADALRAEPVTVDGAPAVYVPGLQTGTYRLYDLRTGAVLATGTVSAGSSTAIAVGDRTVVAGPQDDDATVPLRDAITGEPVGPPLEGHEGIVTDMQAVTAGGRPYLLTLDTLRTVRIWDLAMRVTP